MEIDELTFGQAKRLAALFYPAQAAGMGTAFDALIGKNIVIRTVTMIFTGRLVEVHPQELVIVDAAWIADTKRWAQFIAAGEVEECEPYPDGQRVIVGRGALIDATEWRAQLPRQPR